MSRQAENYNALLERLVHADVDLGAIRDRANAMQRDLNHGLAHVQTALDILEHAPANGHVFEAREQLRDWLRRMGIGETDIDLAAGECDGDCPDGEAAEALEADRDELSSTVERLYDGINAALVALDGWPDDPAPTGVGHARRILRDLRTTEITADMPAPFRCANCGAPIHLGLRGVWFHDGTSAVGCGHRAEPMP